MSERIYAFLLRLYPSRFREGYKDEALQLYRDLSSHETGVSRRSRLWLGLLADLAIGFPQAYRNSYAFPASTPLAQGAQTVQGRPMFSLLEGHSLRPELFLMGGAFSFVAVGALSVVLSHPAVYRAGSESGVSRSPIESVLERLNRSTVSDLFGDQSQSANDGVTSPNRVNEAQRASTPAAKKAVAKQNERDLVEHRNDSKSVGVKADSRPREAQQQSNLVPVMVPQNAALATQTAPRRMVVAAHATAKTRGTPGADIITIQQATIIAFCPPSTAVHGQVANDSEALSDFEFYAERVKQPLDKIGVTFQVVRTPAIRIRLGSDNTVFRPKTDLGYYMIAPGKKPRIEYGVMSDSDLLSAAKQYFGPAGRK